MTTPEQNPRQISDDFADWLENGGMSQATFQPGEKPWAYFKCGEGVHAGEMQQSHPFTAQVVGAVCASQTIQEIPYTGTEAPTTITDRTLRDPLEWGV